MLGPLFRGLPKPSRGRFFKYMKEVIQGHLPVALPCYDFTMVKNPSFDDAFLKG